MFAANRDKERYGRVAYINRAVGQQRKKLAPARPAPYRAQSWRLHHGRLCG
jgi:hypothetical protein